ncbi:hypothetical protein C5167_036759 [Papaver somniferum]|uniref:Uncharacterized protein n=1 Tax=Papaver somniferum TaxID=3469 RepID=A0A4Y7I7Z0_PAPSO|nr:hypothetical protein C5167_036759 [Papaver somniferum]
MKLELGRTKKDDVVNAR